jgi:hypothetical protein
MKITLLTTTNRRKRKDGVAAIIMLALLALVLTFIFANLRALSDLRGELKIIEQKQIRRLNHSMTNTPPGLPTTNSPIADAAKPL